MPSCAVLSCKNRHDKGYTMKRFPTDPVRRKKWIELMNRPNWTPTNSSYICESHFAPNMWEKPRVDGKHKLRTNAIPTLFRFKIPPEPREKGIISPFVKYEEPLPITEVNIVHTDLHLEPEDEEFIIQPKISLDEAKLNAIKIDPLTIPTAHNMGSTNEIELNTSKKEIAALKEKLSQYEKEYRKNVHLNRNLRNALRKTRYELKKVNSTRIDLPDRMTKMFSADQIKSLRRNSTRFFKWSKETLEKSYKLRISCGTRGYKELLRQHYPLPSLRTLRRYYNYNIGTDSKKSIPENSQEIDPVTNPDEAKSKPQTNVEPPSIMTKDNIMEIQKKIIPENSKTNKIVKELSKPDNSQDIDAAKSKPQTNVEPNIMLRTKDNITEVQENYLNHILDHDYTILVVIEDSNEIAS